MLAGPGREAPGPRLAECELTLRKVADSNAAPRAADGKFGVKGQTKQLKSECE